MRLGRLRKGLAERAAKAAVRAASREGSREGEGGGARRGRLEVEAREWRGSIVLEGRATSWEDKVEVGFYAAGFGYKGVVNDVEVEGLARERLEPAAGPADPAGPEGRPLEGRSFDVAVVGGGVVGCAVARELTRWKVSVVLLEKETDVAVHTTSRNDGMIHDGFAAKPGTLKARYNVRGNRMWELLARELGLEFRRPGSLILFRSSAAQAAYPLMAARARENGVEGWEYWSRARVREREPNASDDQRGGFFLPSAGVISPYKATIALAECAAANGATIALGVTVTGFDEEDARITRVRTDRGDFRVGAVVNAAGNWADWVAGLANDRFFSLHQRRGTDLVLDSRSESMQRHILAMPSLLQAGSRTKGGGLVPTVEGNVLVGPTAAEAPGREDYATTAAELRELERLFKANKALSPSMTIAYFAGVRPCTYEEDFIVERSDYVRNLVHAAGIQSPGLASSPAIAQDVALAAIDALRDVMSVVPSASFDGARRAPVDPRRMSWEARAELAAERPDFGRIVCRCECVSEGEVREALRSPVRAPTLDAVKRRTRAGAGRCHGAFCAPRVARIIASEAGLPLAEVTKKGPLSRLAVAETKSPGPDVDGAAGGPDGSAIREAP